MEWIEPVDVKSAVKFSSSLVNSADEECRNIIHGSITGKKKFFLSMSHLHLLLCVVFQNPTWHGLLVETGSMLCQQHTVECRADISNAHKGKNLKLPV